MNKSQVNSSFCLFVCLLICFLFISYTEKEGMKDKVWYNKNSTPLILNCTKGEQKKTTIKKRRKNMCQVLWVFFCLFVCLLILFICFSFFVLIAVYYYFNVSV